MSAPTPPPADKRRPIPYQHATCYVCSRPKNAETSHCPSPCCPWCSDCAKKHLP